MVMDIFEKVKLREFLITFGYLDNSLIMYEKVWI